MNHTPDVRGDEVTTLTSAVTSHISNQSDIREVYNNCVILGVNVTVPWDNPNDMTSMATEEMVDRIKTVVFIPILFLVGFPTNILNLVVFAKQGLKERINVCLFTLALVDVMSITIVFAIYAERVYTQFTSGERLGPTFTYAMNNNVLGLYGLGYASYFLSAVISAERCACVLFPFQARKCISTKVFTLMIVVCILLLTFLRFLVTAQYTVTCYYEARTGRLSRRIGVTAYRYKHMDMIKALDGVFYGFCISVGCPMVAFITTAITAVKLYQTVRWRKTTSYSSGGSTTNSSSTSSSVSSKEVAVTKMLICLSIEFFILSIPAIILRVSSVLEPRLSAGGMYANTYLVLISLGELSFFASSSVNFFVYYLAGSRYRNTLKALVCRKPEDASVQSKASDDSRIEMSTTVNPGTT